MFPVLFVTIACGAVSGFHSLVSSGTASKQIKSEKNMLPVSFGAMLMESMLAVISLVAVASFATGAAAEQGYTTPAQIFAGGISNFLGEGGDGLKVCHRHLCRHQAREASANHATECSDATGVLRVVKRDEYIHHFLPSHLRDGGMASGLGGESGAVI